MNCLTMKSTSAKGKTICFTLNDLPVPVDNNYFILLGRSNTPILELRSILRGDPESGLYEGDIVRCDGELWLVCYERGFYLINKAYVVRYFSSEDDYEYVGDCSAIDFEIPLKTKKKHLFKYGTTAFFLQDIVGAVNGKLILKMFADPIDIDKVCQECAFTYNGHKAFFGDTVGDDKIHLENGRLIANAKDLALGG